MNRSSEEKESFLHQSQSRDYEDAALARQPSSPLSHSKLWSYLRLFIEAVMLLCIAVLSFTFSTAEPRNLQHTLQTTPVPRLPRKLYTFAPDPHYLHDAMFESSDATLHTLHNWIPLSSDARGYVHVPDWEKYPDLPEPHVIPIDRMRDGPSYMVSSFHQLHCLSYLTEHFGIFYRTGGAELSSNETQKIAHHGAHCFDYLRQAIMCAGDTSLEGTTESGPGWGSVHECVDYEALQEWANDNSAQKWRNDIMPEDAVL